MDAKFCVIATSAINRVFKSTKELAEEHGHELLTKQYLSTGKPAKLFVVEVVGVIEVGKPVVETRPPTDEDFPVQAEADDASLSDEEFGAKRGSKPRRHI